MRLGSPSLPRQEPAERPARKRSVIHPACQFQPDRTLLCSTRLPRGISGDHGRVVRASRPTIPAPSDQAARDTSLDRPRHAPHRTPFFRRSHLDTDSCSSQTVCILSTRNWLHDLDDETELDVCISGAREIAAIIKLWIRQLQIEELKDTRNVKTTSRTQNGIGGPYVLTPWFWNADRLVKAAKLLRAMGREEGELPVP